MASRGFIRPCSAQRVVRQALSQNIRPSNASITALRTSPPSLAHASAQPASCRRAFHETPSRRKGQQPPAQAPPTDFGELDMLGNTPVPSTSVDVCMYDGFGLNSGTTITDGNGALLVDGEAFNWRPWEAKGSLNLINKKGQFELPPQAFALFDLIWPRPGEFFTCIPVYHLPCRSLGDGVWQHLTDSRRPSDHWSWSIHYATGSRNETTPRRTGYAS